MAGNAASNNHPPINHASKSSSLSPPPSPASSPDRSRALIAGQTTTIGGGQFTYLERGHVNDLRGARIDLVCNIHRSNRKRTTLPNFVTNLVTDFAVDYQSPSPGSSSRGNGRHMPPTSGANRVEHLIELARGLERLHDQGIVLEGLRNDNAAYLLNPSNSRPPQGLVKCKTSSENNDHRWLAPEVLRDKKLTSKHADVWSFGMVCLAILSGDRPFAELEDYLDVVRELWNGSIPKRPGKAAVEQGLSDAMWELLRSCWQEQPESRPSITQVKNTLLTVHGHAMVAGVKPPKPPDRSATFPQPGRPTILPSISGETAVKPSTPMSAVSHGFESLTSTSDESSGMTSRSSSSSNTSYHTTSVGHSPHKVQIGSFPHLQLPPFDFESRPNTSPPLPAHARIPPFTRASVTPRENDHSSHARDVTPKDSGGHALPGLHEAVTTLEIIVALDTSGQVQGGTLEGLLDRLITNINSADVQYGDILLTACAELTTSDHLFSILSTRFYEVKRDPRKNSQERVTIQLNTLMVMKRWLSVRCLTGETQLLVQVRSFCELAAQMETSETVTSKAIELIDLIDCMREGTISPHHPGQPMFQRSQMTPRNLAIALTLLEGDKYTALTPTDYILHLQGGPAANRVEDARTTNNLIIQWIQDYILCPDTVRGRAEAIRLFINTAQECRNLRNFASFVAIISALHSPPIARLKMTKAELEVPMQRQLESLQNKINPSSNYSHYRKLLKQSSRTEERDRCIPWLSVHLEDLRKPLQKHHTLRKVDGRMLINFCRYVKFTDQIKEVLPYCTPDGPDLEDFREQGRLAYLEHQLHHVEAAAQSANDFMERSKARELYSGAQERLTKLKGLGFRTSQS